MNHRDELIRLHARSAAEYSGFFFNTATSKPYDMSAEEAAYYLLAHTGMVYRYAGDQFYLQGLIQQDPAARKEIVLFACRYIAGMILKQKTEMLYKEDVLEPEDIEQAETLLMQRDELECALTFAVQLTEDLIDADAELRQALAGARCDVSDLDEVLRARQDVMSVASRSLEGIAECICAKIDKRSYWWLYEAATWDKNFEENAPADLKLLLQSSSPPPRRNI